MSDTLFIVLRDKLFWKGHLAKYTFVYQLFRDPVKYERAIANPVNDNVLSNDAARLKKTTLAHAGEIEPAFLEQMAGSLGPSPHDGEELDSNNKQETVARLLTQLISGVPSETNFILRAASRPASSTEVAGPILLSDEFRRDVLGKADLTPSCREAITRDLDAIASIKLSDGAELPCSAQLALSTRLYFLYAIHGAQEGNLEALLAASGLTAAQAHPPLSGTPTVLVPDSAPAQPEPAPSCYRLELIALPSSSDYQRQQIAAFVALGDPSLPESNRMLRSIYEHFTKALSNAWHPGGLPSCNLEDNEKLYVRRGAKHLRTNGLLQISPNALLDAGVAAGTGICVSGIKPADGTHKERKGHVLVCRHGVALDVRDLGSTNGTALWSHDPKTGRLRGAVIRQGESPVTLCAGDYLVLALQNPHLPFPAEGGLILHVIGPSQ